MVVSVQTLIPAMSAAASASEPNIAEGPQVSNAFDVILLAMSSPSRKDHHLGVSKAPADANLEKAEPDLNQLLAPQSLSAAIAPTSVEPSQPQSSAIASETSTKSTAAALSMTPQDSDGPRQVRVGAEAFELAAPLTLMKNPPPSAAIPKQLARADTEFASSAPAPLRKVNSSSDAGDTLRQDFTRAGASSAIAPNDNQLASSQSTTNSTESRLVVDSGAVSTPAERSAVAAPAPIATFVRDVSVSPAPLHVRADFIVTSVQKTDQVLELRLDPPDLGKLSIELTTDDNGRVRAIVSAERPETLDMARRHVEQFRQELVRYGMSDIAMDFSDAQLPDDSSSNNPKQRRQWRHSAERESSFDQMSFSAFDNGRFDVVA